jgi:hypothetical protein
MLTDLKQLKVNLREMDRFENLTFGLPRGPVFSLETRRDPTGVDHLALKKDDVPIKGLLDPSLRLLRFLAQRSPKAVSNDAILDALWPKSAPAIIDTHISYLRAALGDNSSNPAFIETIFKKAHRFMVAVTPEGDDLTGLEAFSKWNRTKFYELLQGVTRGPDEDPDDLHIITTGFSSGLAELDLKGLIRRRIRIRILLMNPNIKALSDARYAERRDKTPADCLDELGKQINQLRELATQYPPAATDERKGSLEYEVSDLLPCGFVIQSRQCALLGTFLAHDSYVEGPMLYIPSTSYAWEQLSLDWEARWKRATQNSY